ncbi:MAG: hypothetical protein IT371_16755 [Deltaproteobacteria bacterium]|nr:hypothetical protein [Deltaproteobacteria bacterium]
MTRRHGVTVLALLGWSAGLAAGCGGTIDTSQRISKLELRTDQLGALQAMQCLKVNGEDACARYPNPNACDRLDVSVMGDGSTVAECLNGGVVVKTIVGSMAGGVPFVCKLADEKGCVTCADMYGVIVTDSCNTNTRLFVDSALEEQPPAAGGGEPGAAPVDRCDPQNARRVYAEELNKVLAAEGLKFTYAPDFSRTTVDKNGMFKTSTKTGDICTYWEQQAAKDNQYTECNVKQPGRCNCEVSSTRTTCKCGRLNIRALRAACTAIPSDCQRGEWTQALTIEYAAANVFLFKGSYKKTTPPAPTQPTTGDRSKTSAPAPSLYQAIPTPVESAPADLQCQGSPLVLDLSGDGVNLLPVDEGPTFDLLGLGEQRTAWVRGDDALLVLDRNGNGRVDSGRELFGEASEVSGPTEDGFQALAVLDRPEQGGNGDGRIDAGDRSFAQLRLWNDRNGDGVSQKSELRSLRQAGVRSLGLEARPTGKTDRFGNDLRLESSFVGRHGRRGLLVDAFFVVK